MKIGMIGLGRMGANMVLRLMEHGHECVVHDRSADAVQSLAKQGAEGHTDLADFVAALPAPRTVWLMIPAGVVDAAVAELAERLDPGDVVIDGGNSFYQDDMRRAAELRAKGIDYLDVGTSGGVWGRERGYCLMIGGPQEAVRRLDPVFQALAPGRGDIPRTPGRESLGGTAEQGYLHCGPAGAGHFVKMVHNGIEYGVMAAYAEGFNILKHADAGHVQQEHSAETTPMRDPDAYKFDLDLADVAEVWRRGSVISSWLLDLTATALAENPTLEGFAGRVSDSGEGRWTAIAAIETGTPAPVLTAALYQRFSSRGEDEFAGKVLSAMRYQFGGHHERKSEG
ncbi:MAG TPA: decarboxylating 6-phosphogluconate dehydrogenase [Candidatus Krumholzibacteria bacterium]|nr:decarboxylating 6-phosphogluconate dehydrogenase [Candidatus Krumholzibacteria bacterium]